MWSGLGGEMQISGKSRLSNSGCSTLKLTIVAAGCCVVTSCSPDPDGSQTLTWETVTDGSKVSVSSDRIVDDPAWIIRCWRDSSGYDCVKLQAGLFRDAVRVKSPALPNSPPNDDPLAGLPGYSCSIGHVGSGYQEEISSEHGKLTSNVISGYDDLEPGWSKKYVDDYIAENVSRPVGKYFSCSTLASKVQEGSIAALASTSVSLDLLK